MLSVGKNEALFVPSVLMLIFAEALALYGLIVGLILGVSPVSKVSEWGQRRSRPRRPRPPSSHDRRIAPQGQTPAVARRVGRA